MVYRPKINPKLCFVALPLRRPFTDYFAGIIEPAARDAGLTATTSAQIYGTGPIIQDIWNQIWAASIVVADVTGKNPNVNYELGLCHALGVPTIILSQSMDDVPFDYRHRRCILYDTTDVDWQSRLRTSITETISKVLSGDPVEDDLPWPYDTRLLREAKRVGMFVASQDATEDVIRGAALVRDAAARSYGPHGVVISVRIHGQERLLSRGSEIATNTWSQNRLEAAGIVAMRQVTHAMRDRIADGTKLAIVLAYEFMARGYSALRDGYILRDVIHGMDTAVEKAIGIIKDQSKTLTGPELKSVSKSAALGDEDLATLIVEAMKKAGKDGIIVVEANPSSEDFLEALEGMQFDRGYLDEAFVTDGTRDEVVLEDAYVFVSDQKLSAVRELLPFLDQVAQAKKPLLIIAEDVDGEVLATLKLNKQKNVLQVAAVRCPGFGDRRKAILEDIAILTGGTVISRESGISLQRLSLAQLGKARHIAITKDSTSITGGAGSQDAVDARIQAIRNQIEVTRADMDREKLQERLAKLSGAICIVSVGTEGDAAPRLHRAESAMFSARAAVESGIVPGGGSALWHVGQALLSLAEEDSGKKAGIMAVASGLVVPLHLQVENAKANLREVLASLTSDDRPTHGFNAQTRQTEDLFTSGVLDPTDLIVRALRASFVHARNVLQTGAWGEEESAELETNPGSQ